MDTRAVINSVLKGAELREVVSALEGTLAKIIDKTATPASIATPVVTPTPPPSPLAPAVAAPSNKPPPVDTANGGCGRCTAQHFFDKPAAANVYIRQAPLISQRPVCGGHNGMLTHDVYKQQAGYVQRQYNNVPVLGFPTRADHNMRPVGFLNGDVVYQMPANIFTPPDFAATIPLNMCLPNSFTQHFNKADENHPYVKKPLNAFMIFRKEQRPIVMAEQKIRDSATVNAIVGQKWKGLTKEEQARYYKEAEIERLLHAQKHPNWSSKYNYGKSKMKNRRNKESVPTDDKKPVSVCVTEPFTALVLSPAPTQNQMMLMDNPNHLAIQTHPLFLRHPNTSGQRFKAPQSEKARIQKSLFSAVITALKNRPC